MEQILVAIKRCIMYSLKKDWTIMKKRKQ